MRTSSKLAAACAAALLWLGPPRAVAAWGGLQELAAEESPEFDDLLDLGFEDLLSMDIEVTSATRTQGVTLAEAPAALYVIGEDEIRRSGLASIPDLLRLVPGLHVGQTSANGWAVGARGTNARFNRDLLVLRDGRTLYTPVFSGVYWDHHDTVLEDLSRIEVIRGPGGTLWGANAVNGVINVISKPAEETQGLLLSAIAGTEEQIASLRYGGRVSDATAWRVFGKGRWQDDGKAFGSGVDANDEYRAFTGGFRIDHVPADGSRFTLQGDGFDGRFDQNGLWGDPPALGIRSFTDDVEAWGANLMARWTHAVDSDRTFSIQGYVDHYERDEQFADHALTTVDVEGSYAFPIGDRHRINVGANIRYTADELRGTTSVFADPESRNDLAASLYVQDTWTVSDDLTVFLGTKVAYNEYTGVEVQPSARFVWRPAADHVLWGAVSRAVRVPSRVEENGTVILATLPGPTPIGITPNDELDAEELVAFELGHRWSIDERTSLDSAFYYNTYDELIQQAIGPYQNAATAESSGLELTLNWSPVDSVGIVATYGFVEYDLDPSSASGNRFPQQQASLRTYVNVTEDIEVNALAWYVDDIAVSNLGLRADEPLDPILRVDMNVVWRPSAGIELAAGVRNLLDDRQLEFSSAVVAPVALERSVYGRIRFEF